VFAKNLIGDILSYPELAESTISLFDIDAERLRTSEIVAHKLAAALGARPTIEATTERRRALDSADYAICMIQVGGYKPATISPRSTACARRSATRSASAGSCAACAPCPSCWICARIWRSSAPT
jgi:alpha-galactosidase/6-phospho-beta-glucosidase family protein